MVHPVSCTQFEYNPPDAVPKSACAHVCTSRDFFQTNPPFFCPLVEVCPAPYTRPWVRDGALRMLRETGQEPVLLLKELPGFVLNRMQYAFMNECWRLVQVRVAWALGLGAR